MQASVEVIVREIPIDVADGSRLVATLRRPAELEDETPTVLCFPAMGVRASYYRPLAAALCERGLPAVTVDLRGSGTSSVRAGRRTDFGYREVVEIDFPAVLAAVREELPGRRVFALGHSLGGQLACLFAAARPTSLAGLVLIASCSIYYRCWKFPGDLSLLALAQTAKWTARVLGFFPGHLVRFGGREARGLVADWAFQGRTGRYEVAGSRLDFEALLPRLTLPILAISFGDDAYAPSGAVHHLLGKMAAAPVTHHHLTPEELGVAAVGHFGWVRLADRLLPRIEGWLGLLRHEGAADAIAGARASRA